MSILPGRLLSSMAAALAAAGVFFDEEGASLGGSSFFARGFSFGLLGMVLGVTGLALALLAGDRLGRLLSVAAFVLCAAAMTPGELEPSIP